MLVFYDCLIGMYILRNSSQFTKVDVVAICSLHYVLGNAMILEPKALFSNIEVSFGSPWKTYF